MSAEHTSEWGRIDDSGTVYVRIEDGERIIGSWQAGDPAAGLAYYSRRYADLVTEVGLLQNRLDSGAGDAKATWAHAAALQDSLADASVLGDLAGLSIRLGALKAAAEAKLAEQVLAKEADRSAAIAAKELLAAEAEGIAASSTQWKAAGDRMRAIVEDWKKIKGIDRKTDEALWKRYAAARDAFSQRRGQHFAGLDAERSEAKAAKEALVAQAQKLSESSDWRETADAMKRLMTEWKAAPRASKGEEDALWARFRGAQDAFFARRSETFAERDAGELENQKLKEAIIAEAEAIDIADPRKAIQKLAALGERFDEVGHVPRDALRGLDERMQAAERRVREAADASRPAPATTVANPFLAAMVERLAEAQAKLDQARRSGDAQRIAKAEADVQARRALLPASAATLATAAAAGTAGAADAASKPAPKVSRNQWTRSPLS